MKSENSPGPVGILVPTGMRGAGVNAEHVRRGIARGAAAIAVDSGSTDSGPYYLARGVSKVDHGSVKRDLKILIAEAFEANIPLLVGSCATSGTDQGVNWTLSIAEEIVAELGITPKIACLYSEQDKDLLKRKNASGKITPLAPMGTLSNDVIDTCEHIVALMGPEPYMNAIEQGADVVLGGRTSDAAVVAAVALMKGAGTAPAWHAAKISECGDLCTVRPALSGVLTWIGQEAFAIEPLDPANQASTESVSAHLLYESSDPFRLIEPGGILDAERAVYVDGDREGVSVTGSAWAPQSYTMKLEGARGGPFQTIMIIGIEDPEVLSQLDLFQEKMLKRLHERVDGVFAGETCDYDLSLRAYGWNGTSGRPVAEGVAPPVDAGIMLVVTAPTQELANRIAQCCNPVFFHMPIRPDIELPSYAFPFTPAEIPRGQVFEFVLNHVVHTSDGLELVRMRWAETDQLCEMKVSHA